jgi:hypothetical protein
MIVLSLSRANIHCRGKSFPLARSFGELGKLSSTRLSEVGIPHQTRNRRGFYTDSPLYAS